MGLGRPVTVGEHHQPDAVVPQVGDRHMAAVGAHIQLRQLHPGGFSPVQREYGDLGRCGKQQLGLHLIIQDTIVPIKGQLGKGPGLHPGTQRGQVPAPEHIIVAAVILGGKMHGGYLRTVVVFGLPVADEGLLLIRLDPQVVVGGLGQLPPGGIGSQNGGAACHKQGQQAGQQQNGGGDLFVLHDAHQPLLQLRFFFAQGGGGNGAGQGVDGGQGQQRLAVGLLLAFGHGSDDSLVTGKLAAAVDLPAQPWHKGIEPMEGGHRHGKPLVQQIPAAKMGQLVAQDALQLQGGDGGFGQDDPGPDKAHQHGSLGQRTAEGLYPPLAPQTLQKGLLMLPKGQAVLLQAAAEAEIADGKP